MNQSVKELRKIFESEQDATQTKSTVKELLDKFEDGSFAINDETSHEDENDPSSLLKHAIQSIQMLHKSRIWDDKTQLMNPKIKEKFDEIDDLFEDFAATEKHLIGDELVKQDAVSVIVYYLDVFTENEHANVYENSSYDMECQESTVNLTRKCINMSEMFRLKLRELQTSLECDPPQQHSSNCHSETAAEILLQEEEEEEVIEEILQVVEEEGEYQQDEIATEIVIDARASLPHNVETWTCEQTEVWIEEKQISLGNCTEVLDGKLLSFLKKLKLEAPEFFYRCLTEKLGLLNLNDQMIFTKAIERL